ncbi:hypothetical protein WICPIJ_005798 [Wickerhamomyces pijperi]|uniref:Uncharacterized protein n=1 Tax=Wickerhamomyces pijperi TaxID=599730 RepID=A0A9P8TLM5_WICPI|nr:hypothetical protein WICPIJ_005798 [Wickerhamomyces pijperi]
MVISVIDRSRSSDWNTGSQELIFGEFIDFGSILIQLDVLFILVKSDISSTSNTCHNLESGSTFSHVKEALGLMTLMIHSISTSCSGSDKCFNERLCGRTFSSVMNPLSIKISSPPSDLINGVYKTYPFISF